MKKRDFLFIILTFIVLVYICLVYSTVKPFVNNGDALFLWNRLKQIHSCFADGIYPFFYYNDFTGVGHGSSFFYGQFTLFPFLPLVKFGIEKFMLSYILVIAVLTYLGVCSFAKRFTSEYRFVGFLYVSSSMFIQLIWCHPTYSCYLAEAIAFFFLAQCVDVFRDDKSYIKCSLLFLLVFNTHTITTLLAFIGCACIFIYYLDISKYKKYLGFFFLTVCLCSYNMANYITHMESLHSLDKINELFDFFADCASQTTLSPLCVGGGLWTLIYSVFMGNYIDVGLRFCCFSLAIVLLVCFIKGLRCKRHIPIYLIIIVGFVAGIRHVWSFIFKFWKVPIQFSNRYLPFLFVVFIILCIKNLKSVAVKIVLSIIVTIDVIAFGMIGIAPSDSSPSSFEIVGNGEYLSDNFVFETESFKKYSTHVIGDDNKEYDYEVVKDRLIINLETNTSSTITVPKLYYNGYIAEDSEGNRHGCYEGYSMFTEVNVNNFNGTLTVRYQHPMYLIILLVSVYVLSFVLCIVDLVYCIRKQK